MKVTVFQQEADFSPLGTLALFATALGTLKGPVCSLEALRNPELDEDFTSPERQLITFGQVLLDKKTKVRMGTQEFSVVPQHVKDACLIGFRAILKDLKYKDPSGVSKSYAQWFKPLALSFVESCAGGDLQLGVSETLCEELTKHARKAKRSIEGITKSVTTESGTNSEPDDDPNTEGSPSEAGDSHSDDPDVDHRDETPDEEGDQGVGNTNQSTANLVPTTTPVIETTQSRDSGGMEVEETTTQVAVELTTLPIRELSNETVSEPENDGGDGVEPLRKDSEGSDSSEEDSEDLDEQEGSGLSMVQETATIVNTTSALESENSAADQPDGKTQGNSTSEVDPPGLVSGDSGAWVDPDGIDSGHHDTSDRDTSLLIPLFEERGENLSLDNEGRNTGSLSWEEDSLTGVLEYRVVRSTDASTEVSQPEEVVASTERPNVTLSEPESNGTEINSWKEWIFQQLREYNTTNETRTFPLTDVEAELFWVFMGSLNETLMNSSETMDLSTVLSVRRLLLHVQGLRQRQWVLGMVFVTSTVIMCCASLMLIARNSHALAKFTSKRVCLARMRRRHALNEKRIAEEECLSGELERLILKRNVSVLVPKAKAPVGPKAGAERPLKEVDVCTCESTGSESCGCVVMCAPNGSVKEGSTHGQKSVFLEREPLKASEVLKDYPELRKEVERSVKKAPSAPRAELYPDVLGMMGRDQVEGPPPEYPGVRKESAANVTNPGPGMGNPGRIRFELERLGEPTQEDISFLLRNKQNV